MPSAFEKQFKVFVGQLNADASKAVAAAARQGEKDIVASQQARRGVPPGVLSAVDGVQGRPYEEVKPAGVIVQLYDYRAEVVYALFRELTARSPVLSGKYRRSHFAMLDGVALDPLTVPVAARIGKVQRIVVTNREPYSLKLELGLKRDGSPFVRQVEPHIYESAAAAVRREFSSVTKIRFATTQLPDGYVIKTWGRSSAKTRKDRRRGPGTGHFYPAVIIERADL